jgi:serine/threonine-protein kinase
MSMLAKDPKNRPADAIKLSEAAEAIRNGDIAAAHAAVPGMLLFEAATGPITAPVDVPTAATSVIGSSAAEDKSTSATSALPVVGAAGAGAAAGLAAGAAAASGYGARNALNRADALAAERSWVQEEEEEDYDEPEEEPKRRGRSPWTWPLIALILLVVFALVGVVLSQAGSLFPSQGPAASSATSSIAKPSSATPSASSASPTETPTPTPSSATPTESTPAAVNLIPDAYLGRPYNDVRNELIGKGLQVTGVEVVNDATPGTVTNIDPSGAVQPGTTITVSYSKGPEMVEVPSIKAGASEAEVQQAIQDAGLRWAKGADVSPTNKKEDPGTFVSSQPPSGSKVTAGSVVTYHLAKATAASPSPSATKSGP